ncbi:vanadium-dependent haloperoxidase [Neobacillus cucumis]|uniref:Phosphoesterase n=1 Tax=Neobacillus cucumis TaxID=1740721 RepID=A0A2N5HFH6_9BACI|nr:vanadium-dependent haloperoxidase [Neobacillus cucumis]PLS04257.1 phosphoesterase [Neobacillus cucumis]
MFFKNDCLIELLSPYLRSLKAFKIRKLAALFYKKLPLLHHPCNKDEERYLNKVASYSKALPHNNLGEVNLDAYNKYLKALKTGIPHDFEKIPLSGLRKLVNPQAAYAFELVGPDSHQLIIPPPPSFDSAEMASEMVELFWQALTRDVPFNEYDTNDLTITAAKELSALIDFRGPKIGGKVTPETLFRENLPGALAGPYISQFLWKDIPYVGTKITQRYQTTLPKDDHLTSYEAWLAVQNGLMPTTPCPNKLDPIPRYIRNGRDLCRYVYNDWSVEDGLTPCLILLSFGSEAWDSNNPYLRSNTQVGFSTFGAPHVLDFVTRAARSALEAAWFQKWLVHRRIRPEEFGGQIENVLANNANYPIHPQVLKSDALALTYDIYKSYLLPQAYAEGCPAHPSYPAGHAAFIGAIVTILKAFFNESFKIPNPVVASSDGLSLECYTGPDLTVGGELNKLAYNIALGRDAAGVHFRSDGITGLHLGEAVAIGILRDYNATYNEQFKGFCFTKFDGTPITI